MRKKLVFFIGIVLLCLISWGFFLYNKPHVGVGNAKPDVTMLADDLYKQYNENETTANQKFLNKVIAVTGTVDEVNTSNNAFVILLKKADDMGGVSCNLFTNTNANIQQGKTVTIKGRCTGFLMDVALTDCVVQQ